MDQERYDYVFGDKAASRIVGDTIIEVIKHQAR